jgi:hypothetical protein
MKKYEITTEKVVYTIYTITAENEEEAKKKYYRSEEESSEEYVQNEEEDIIQIEEIKE